MTRGLTRASVCLGACALIGLSATAAVAKGPDQAVVSGPGLAQPIVVQAPGTPTFGPDMVSLIRSSDIFDQLWCHICADLSSKQPKGTLGPMYLVRYRVPSLIGGPTRWVEQRVYPFAEPRPLTFVAPGQRFWQQRTEGGWYEAGRGLRTTLVNIGVPSGSTLVPQAVDTASVTHFRFSPGVTAGGIVIMIAIVVALVLSRRAWMRPRSSTHARPA